MSPILGRFIDVYENVSQRCSAGKSGTHFDGKTTTTDDIRFMPADLIESPTRLRGDQALDEARHGW
jgi:hypothetical protein